MIDHLYNYFWLYWYLSGVVLLVPSYYLWYTKIRTSVAGYMTVRKLVILSMLAWLGLLLVLYIVLALGTMLFKSETFQSIMATPITFTKKKEEDEHESY